MKINSQGTNICKLNVEVININVIKRMCKRDKSFRGKEKKKREGG